jgi:uncharacterized protein involved in exopolysaccharide biosynthesis
VPALQPEEMVDQLSSTVRKDEIDLTAITGVIMRSRWLVLTCALVMGVAAYIMAYTLLPVTYRADVTITDVRESTSLGAGLLGGNLGGLASLAGVSLGGAGAAEREARAVLKSRRLVEEFISRNNLLPVLLRNSKKPPTLWRAVKYFQGDVVTIREDLRQGTTTVTIEWTDAATAARWANGFVALANELIRTNAQQLAQRNITYLNEQVAKTNVVELQRVLFNIIEGETKTLMVASGRVEYAFKIVDPAVAPELRAGPHRTLIALLGAMLGGFIGVIAALVLSGRKPVKAAE